MLTMMTLSAVAALSGGQEYAPQQDGPQRVAPRGSYTQSCSGDYVNQGRLYADCRDERGRVRGTSILLNQCSQYDIANRNGLLVCGPNRGEYEEDSASGGGWGGGNGGGWGNRASITVYRDANYRGASQTFDGEVRDLARAGMNDQISSMRFRGEWEACTDANFRGYCQRFTGDVRNLSNYGMNDRISSLRPVRGYGRGDDYGRDRDRRW